MKALVVEDDLTSRLFLQETLVAFGEVYLALNGAQAVTAFRDALVARRPYDLICMDILMPEMDGVSALREIRRLEEEARTSWAKVVMTTALGKTANVMSAFREQCDAYLVKPIDQRKLLEQLRRFGLLAPLPAAGSSASA